MDSKAHPASLWRRPTSAWIVWPGLLVAFSPVLLELADHLIASPWSRSALIFPWLSVVAIRADGARAHSKRLIWACIALGILIELVAVSGGILRLGRVGLVVAVVGVVWGAGWARPAVCLLLVWTLPLPSALMRLASPTLETTWGSAVAALLPGLALDPASSGPALVAGDEVLRLVAPDGGLALGYGLAGLGWFRAVAAGHRIGRASRCAIGWGVSLIPVQLGILAIGGLALVAGLEATRARWLVDQSGWILIGVLGLALAAQGSPAEPPARPAAIRC